MHGASDRLRFMSVQNVMTHDVFCVKGSDRVVDAWLALMEKDFSGAPVLDDDQKLVGILSVTDIYRAIVGRVAEARAQIQGGGVSPAGETMEEDLSVLTASVRTVAESNVSSLLPANLALQTLGTNDSLDRALRLVAEKNVNRLPVVKDGRVVGIITRQDIIEALSGRKR